MLRRGSEAVGRLVLRVIAAMIAASQRMRHGLRRPAGRWVLAMGRTPYAATWVTTR